jgi:hypothetical protein
MDRADITIGEVKPVLERQGQRERGGQASEKLLMCCRADEQVTRKAAPSSPSSALCRFVAAALVLEFHVCR